MAENETGSGSSDSRIPLPTRVSNLPPQRHTRRPHSAGPRPKSHDYYVEDPAGRHPGAREPSSPDARRPHPPPVRERDDEAPEHSGFFGKERSRRRKRNSRHRRYEPSQYADDRDSCRDSEHQDAEDVLNDYLGGTSGGRPTTGPLRDSRPPAGQYYSDVLPEVETRMHGLHGDDYVSRRPAHVKPGSLWARAAKPIDDNTLSGELDADLTIIVTRRGDRFRSKPFGYQTDCKNWTDARFARVLKAEYRNLKTWGMWSFAQKLFAYKTIAFVYFLQSRYVRDHSRRGGGRWEITDTTPITDADDAKAKDSFMYQLRNPPSYDRYVWTDKLDALLEPGAVVDLEIVETFDTIKIYWALLFSILLSLGAALAYGFAMDNDFATGFTIASWMITAFGFFAAVVAAGEYFGMEKATSFQTRAGLEKGVVIERF